MAKQSNATFFADILDNDMVVIVKAGPEIDDGKLRLTQYYRGNAHPDDVMGCKPFHINPGGTRLYHAD